ncbi:MAG TPA: hypothetical protein VIF57_28895 [Polyangia bacterium]|jgi:hypothetical protein
MRSTGLFAALSIVGAAGVGCGSGSDGHGGGSGGLVSCTVSESVGTISLMVCEEADDTAQNVQGLMQACMVPAGGGGLADAGITAGADFEHAGCSHVGALGACRVTTQGMTVTGWYYQDPNGLETPADIQMLCAQAGATYVAP